MPASIKFPGRDGGPCASACSHLECLATRQIAQERCRLCKDLIGFEQPFYSEVDAKVHKHCLEAELADKLRIETELRFLTIEETAELLRVEVGTIRNWISQKKIPFRKAGANILFLLDEVLDWTLPAARKPKASGLHAVE